MDGWSGGARDILNQRVGGRDGDVAGLVGIEFLEEVIGELGLLPDEGVEVMGG